MKHGWTQMQVGSKGAMIRAFKPLMWLRRRPINWRLSFGGPSFHLNTSLKRRPMCCRDWADWARPLLDLHQRHSILMFLRLFSRTHPARSCWGWALALPRPLMICQIGAGWRVWGSLSEVVISNRGAPQGSVLYLHSCSLPTPPSLNPTICRSSLMTLLRLAVLEIDWNQSAGGEQMTLWSGATGIVFSKDPEQIVVNFVRTRTGIKPLDTLVEALSIYLSIYRPYSSGAMFFPFCFWISELWSSISLAGLCL